jgi:Zn-finger nucleic acid-binding protein
MDILGNGSVQMELKYCERCGGLWLRPTDSDLIFCAACSVVMAGLAPNSRFFAQRRPALRLPGRRGAPVSFWSEGGNA